MQTAAARKRADSDNVTIKPAARPRTREIFVARCEARAELWQAGEFDLHEAVDELQAAAVRDGLVAKLGQDEVQAVMSAAFGAVRDDLVLTTVVKTSDEEAPARGVVAASTIMAAEYLVRKGDVERFRTWLDRHSAQERTAIHKHLEARRCRSRQTK
jgi:hypothetical protein